MRLGLAVGVVLVLVLAGCGPVSQGVPEGSDVVFFESERGIAVSDGRAVTSIGASAASPDWSRLYGVRDGRLVTVDPVATRELASAPLPGRFTARVASTSGSLVALTEEPGMAGRERTTIMVADPSGAHPARELVLPGNFAPEAFSSDDAYLFVLEYLPANAPERYRVRRVELSTGSVQPLLLRDKRLTPSGAEEEMRGAGRQAVLSPDRGRLYTLYLHQGDHQHTRDLIAGRRGADGQPVHAFVHVLSLTEGWAYCLDLPEPFGFYPAGTHALAISPDGRTLYVGELASKRIAVADTETLTITRVARLDDEAPSGEATAMEVAPDGAALYVGSANVVRRLDSASLRVDGAWRQPAAVRGLAVSRDGRQVYIGQPDRIVRVDGVSGQVHDSVAAAGLMTVRGSAKPNNSP